MVRAVILVARTLHIADASAVEMAIGARMDKANRGAEPGGVYL
jgi:hypothetical protein